MYEKIVYVCVCASVLCWAGGLERVQNVLEPLYCYTE